MERKQPKLDSSVFAGNVRYVRRSSQYVHRPVRPVTISDIRVAAPKLQPQSHRSDIPSSEPMVAMPVPEESAQPRGEESVQEHTRQPRRAALRRLNWRQGGLYGIALTLFVVGGFVSLSGFRANHQVGVQIKHLQQATADAAGRDTESTLSSVPSTTKPSTKQVKSYAVAPNLPRYLDIPKLHIHTRILSEGVTKSGALAVPWNIYDTGWYNASAQPGQMGGMLVDGHSGIGSMHGVFWQLGKLKAGDAITVTRGDGHKFTYTVTTVKTVDVKKVDMTSMVVSADPAKPGLNLITCAGDRIPGTDELNKRVQVYAVLQS